MKETAAATDHDIVVSRVFDAPRELVFAAWTDPRHIERWWGPQGFTSFGCEIDLRPGGNFGLQMRGPDGAVYPCNGVIREVDAPERIVFVGRSDGGHACGAGLPPRSVVTVTFEEHDGRTTLTIHTQLPSPADRAAAQDAGFVPGWESTLERLAELVANN